MTISIEEAFSLATKTHEGQLDKAGKPYIEHVKRVMQAVSGYERKLAACGHDQVEDTEITLEDLAVQGYPIEVVAAIEALTKRPGETRIAAAHRAAQNPIARDVKLADNDDNSDLSRIPNPTAKDLARTQEYAEVRRILEAAAELDCQGRTSPPRQTQ